MACETFQADPVSRAARRLVTLASMAPSPESRILLRSFSFSSKALVSLDPVETMLDRLDSACAKRSND